MPKVYNWKKGANTMKIGDRIKSGELIRKVAIMPNSFRIYNKANLNLMNNPNTRYSQTPINHSKFGRYLIEENDGTFRVSNTTGGKRGTRRMSKKNRTQKRRMRGGNSVPASVSGNPMGGMMAQSLAQGQQYETMHKDQHGGGALDAGAYPEAVVKSSYLDGPMAVAARVAPLNAALDAIKNLGTPGMAGGRRRGKKSRKASKKSRKASKKSRKASKKSRKASRKNRKTRKMRGGAAYVSSPAPFNGPSMLLSPSLEAKALSGMNAEWKIAENPDAFAPGYKA